MVSVLISGIKTSGCICIPLRNARHFIYALIGTYCINRNNKKLYRLGSNSSHTFYQGHFYINYYKMTESQVNISWIIFGLRVYVCKDG